MNIEFYNPRVDGGIVTSLEMPMPPRVGEHITLWVTDHERWAKYVVTKVWYMQSEKNRHVEFTYAGRIPCVQSGVTLREVVDDDD